MRSNNYSILLADDDEDDRILFEDALREVCENAHLSMVSDGDMLLQFLKTAIHIPDVVFLDLNMPLKNGFECLSEIRNNEKFNKLPVIIVSTSSESKAVNTAYKHGANYYIKKPGTYRQLKKLISKVIQMDWHKKISQPPREQFVLTS